LPRLINPATDPPDGLARIVILQPESKAMKRILFNYKKVISAGEDAEDFFLQPSDIILGP
jgi:hypothetical protein